jgi:hypothetical protein
VTFSHLWWGAEILLRLGAHCVRLYYWLWKDAYEALEIAQIRRCQIRIGKMQCNPCYQSNTISLNENYTSNLNPPLSSPF